MAPTLPRDIHTEILPDGVRWVLPRRELGNARAAGAVLLAIGLFITAAVGLCCYLPLGAGIRLIREGQHSGWAIIAFVLVGLPGLVLGLGLFGAGLATLYGRGHAEVEVRGGKLRAIERAGILHWTWTRPVEAVQRLRIGKALEGHGSGSHGDKAGGIGFGEFATIYVEGQSIKPMRLAPGYRHDWLHALAAAVAAQVDTGGRERLFDDAEAGVEVIAAPPKRQAAGTEETETAPLPVQPLSSRVIVERHPERLTLTIPAKGIWKGSKGMMTFSILWNGILLLITVGVVVGTLKGQPSGSATNSAGGILALLGFSALFWAVGIGTLLSAINMGRRHAIIDVVGDTLLISSQSIFRTLQREWTAEQIDRVQAGPSGMEVNDVPVIELQVHTTDGKKFGCLSQLDNDELRWLAAEINHALGRRPHDPDAPVPPPVAERDPRGELVQPASSRIQVHFQGRGHGVVLTVPPRGFSGLASMLIVGLIFGLIGLGVFVAVAYSTLEDGLQSSDLFTLGFITLWTAGFAGMGWAFAIGALVMARRRFVIEMDNQHLSVDRRGPFGQRHFQWPLRDIRSIEVIDSGTKVGNRAYLTLSIQPTRGSKLRLGAGRSDAELAWLAAVLNQQLQSVAGDRLRAGFT